MATTRATLPKPGAPPISVGIGSWGDPEYVGLIFSKGVKSDERLRIYATHFDHVEVNASFYRIPSASVVDGWVRQTPAAFRFDLKLHQAFSRSPEKTAREGALVAKLLESTQPLVDAGKLGTFFLVLPPSFGPEKHKLEELDALAEKLQPHLLAVELRDSRWVEGEARARTLNYFRARQLVWIAVDMPRIAGSTIMPPIDEVTNPRLAYLRLHGRNKDWLEAKSATERHAYPYPPKQLQEIADRVRTLAAQAEHVHVVANNHAADYAPKTALALQRLLGIERVADAG